MRGDLLDDHDVEREDRERPERIHGDREQCGDGADARGGEPHDAPEQATPPEGAGAEHLEQTDAEGDPAPGIEVADDVASVADEEARVADGGYPVDDVQRSRDQQEDRRERDPTRPLLVHAVPPLLSRAAAAGGPDGACQRQALRATRRPCSPAAAATTSRVVPARRSTEDAATTEAPLRSARARGSRCRRPAAGSSR